VIGFAGLVTFTVTACTSTTPQENYARYIKRNIGENIDTSVRFSSGKVPISKRTLENGNIEYQYPYARGKCIETYEVDSKTRIIVRASYVGSERACQLSP
jgi:hypothetical protein